MRHLPLIPLLVTLAACTAPVYIMPSANAPSFRRAGQLNLGGQVGTNGLDGQGAVSITDNFGAAGTVSATPGNDDGDEHFYGEMAVVGYIPESEIERLRVEFLAGGGYGESSATEVDLFEDPDFGEVVSGSYYRIFGQGNIGFSSKFFDGGAALRLAYVDYDYDSIPGTSIESEDNVFFEPMFFARPGYDMIRFQVQFGFVIPMGAGGPEPNAGHFHFSLGLHLAFDLAPEDEELAPPAAETMPQPATVQPYQPAAPPGYQLTPAPAPQPAPVLTPVQPGETTSPPPGYAPAPPPQPAPQQSPGSGPWK